MDYRKRELLPRCGGRVIDVESGDIQTFQFTTDPSFINDVVLTRDFAWFTNSQAPELYGVPLVQVMPLATIS